MKHKKRKRRGPRRWEEARGEGGTTAKDKTAIEEAKACRGREGGERKREIGSDRRRRLITPICFCRGPHMTAGGKFQYPLVVARVVGG